MPKRSAGRRAASRVLGETQQRMKKRASAGAELMTYHRLRVADTPLVLVRAGVVGLAIAARYAPRQRRARDPGKTGEAGSKDLEPQQRGDPRRDVLPCGSRKARLCVRSSELYARCERLGIAHARLTMSAPELPELERLLALGHANGVELRLLSGVPRRYETSRAGRRRSAVADDRDRERPRAHGLLPRRARRSGASRRRPSSWRSSGRITTIA